MKHPTVDTVVVEIRDGDGALAASVGTHPGTEFIVPSRPSQGATIRIPRVAYRRSFVPGLWGDLVVAGPDTRYEIRTFRADGALARIVRRDHLPRIPTRADLEFDVERELSSEVDDIPDEMLEERRKWLPSQPLAETFPAFSSIMGDAAGHLWVREYDFPGEKRPAPLWTVFDPEGRVLGFVETPSPLTIFEIGEDYLLGRLEDDLGVERIQVWPLERPRV